jgi:hypothetical protein
MSIEAPVLSEVKVSTAKIAAGWLAKLKSFIMHLNAATAARSVTKLANAPTSA